MYSSKSRNKKQNFKARAEKKQKKEGEGANEKEAQNGDSRQNYPELVFQNIFYEWFYRVSLTNFSIS